MQMFGKNISKGLTKNIPQLQFEPFRFQGVSLMNDFDEMELPDSRLSMAYTRQDASLPHGAIALRIGINGSL